MLSARANVRLKWQDRQEQGKESPLSGNSELLHQPSPPYEVTAVITTGIELLRMMLKIIRFHILAGGVMPKCDRGTTSESKATNVMLNTKI